MNTSTHSAPSRRALVRGAAWATPAVAMSVAAPAFANSNCVPGPITLNWSDSTVTRSTSGGVTTVRFTFPDPDATGPRQEVTITATQTFGSNTKGGWHCTTCSPLSSPEYGNRTENRNLYVYNNFQRGGLQGDWLSLHQSPISNAPSARPRGYNPANSQDVVFTITGRNGAALTLSSLKFTITDIDSRLDNHADGVRILKADGTGDLTPTSYQLGSILTRHQSGGATVYGPVDYGRELTDNYNDGRGNATFTLSSVSSFRLRYYNAESYDSSNVEDGTQWIWIGAFQPTYMTTC